MTKGTNMRSPLTKGRDLKEAIGKGFDILLEGKSI
jgi:hypothetical protein